MAHVLRIRNTPWCPAGRHILPTLLLGFLLAPAAFGTAVTYTAVTITDGQLGSWRFQNARVYLTFTTDTAYVSETQIAGVDVAYVGPFTPQQLCTGTPNSVGTARVVVISGQKKVEATFAPNQIFVSLDKDNGGVGFGSCNPNGGFEPAYPIGIDGGTIFGVTQASIVNPSPELAALPIDLLHDVAFSGRAWICVGFPNEACSTSYELQTDKGGLVLSQPYQRVYPGPPITYGDTLHAGLFTAVVDGASEEDGTTYPISSGSVPITYNALFVSDVTIAGQHFSGALIYLSMAADSKAVTRPDANSQLYINPKGSAKLRIVAGHTNISTQIWPGQLYAYFDSSNSTAGFGSFNTGGGLGYPAGFTATEPSDSFYGFESSTLGAVSDIIRTQADAVNYTALTQTLVTNPLTNPTLLTGNVSACPGSGALNPATAVCSNLSPIALATGLGSLYVYEPYTGDATTQPYSVNFGIFWSEAETHDE